MVSLRPTLPTDLEFVLACESNHDASAFILPWTQAQHASAIADPDCAHRVMFDETTDELLSFVLLFGLTSPHHAIEFRRIVSGPKGRGFGRQAVREVKRIAFDRMNAHRLWLDVKSKNDRARHLYSTEGFVEEGVMRECLLEGGIYESLVLMSMLRVEYDAHK